MLLSKSNFTTARHCLTKLYFNKKRYPSTNDTNEYLQYLALIGNKVGHLAQLHYPMGVEVAMERDPLKAVEATTQWMNATEKGVLFEATFLFEGRYVRVDVLEKNGKLVNLIEVKSSGWDRLKTPEGSKEFETKFDKYLDDVTFQWLVASKQFPTLQFTPFLMVMNNLAEAQTEGIYAQLQAEKLPLQGSFQGYNITFVGNPEQLLAQDLMVQVNVQAIAQARSAEVWSASQEMVEALAEPDNFERFRTPLGSKCAGCEYRIADVHHAQNGFVQCWGEKAFAKPHVLDVAKDSHFSRKVDELIREAGVSTITEIPDDALYTNAGNLRVNGRPFYQKNGVRENLDPLVKEQLNGLRYPLYFVDFEAIRSAIPYHKGNRPYGIVLFQWSCHILDAPGAALRHAEFLNTQPTYPNDRFIQALKDCIGNHGTVLTWSSYENTQLKGYLEDLDGPTDPGLVQWLRSVLKDPDGGYRQLDLHNDVVSKGYYHHKMGGRTSIKKVLPAILSEPQSMEVQTWLKAEGLYEALPEGGILDPYKILARETFGVADGSQAMNAYDEMIFGTGSNNQEVKDQLAQALLRYCKLDTLSMVIIYDYLVRRAEVEK